MANLFVHFKTKAAFTAATLGTEYSNDSIVFIQDSQLIWTHGTFYDIPESYQTKITNLESAVSALLAALAADKAIRKVKVGETTFTASGSNETLELAGGNHVTVSINASGKVTLGTDLTATSYYPNASGTSLSTRVLELEEGLFDVTGTGAVKVAEVSGSKTVSLLLAPTLGNVTLSLDTTGLKANISDVSSIAPVLGVAAGDSIISLDSTKKLKSTLGLTYNASTKKILLTGIDGTVIAGIDATAFIKDGMLNNAEFNPTSKVLTLTFNTDSGKEAIEVDLSTLVDSYDGSNLKLKSVAIPSTAAVEPTANDSVDSAIANLIKRDRELKAEIDKINTDIEDVQSGGLSGIDKGTDGKYVTTTVSAKASNRLSIGVAVTTKTLTAATSTADGLATAWDVKNYMTSQITDALSWAEFN